MVFDTDRGESQIRRHAVVGTAQWASRSTLNYCERYYPAHNHYSYG
jgi:hypothetical protein